MITWFKKLYWIWRLKLEIRHLQSEISDYYLILIARRDLFNLEIDVDLLHKQYTLIKSEQIKILIQKIAEVKSKKGGLIL